MPLYNLPKQYNPYFSKPKKKPLCNVEVDRDDLGQYLVFGTLLLQKNLADLHVGKQPTSTTQYLQSVVHGNQGFLANSGSEQINYDTNELIDVNKPFSIIWKGELDAAGNNQAVASIKASSVGGMLIFHFNDGSYRDVHWGGSNSPFSSYKVDFTELVTDLHTYEIHYNGQGDSISNFTFKLNGVEKTISTGATVSGSDNLTVIANRNNGNLPYNGWMEYLFVFNKDLSDVKNLHNEIYQRTLKPSQPSVFSWEGQATGITVAGATASYGYNGVSGTVELTGEIVVTGSTASYGYNGVNGDIDLTSEILITGQTASYSYDGVSGSVDLSGLISVTGQTASYDYDGVLGEVILQGTIVVTGDTANYAYNALNGTIIIQGPITVNPRNVITVKRKSNDIIVSRKSNTVRVK